MRFSGLAFTFVIRSSPPQCGQTLPSTHMMRSKMLESLGFIVKFGAGRERTFGVAPYETTYISHFLCLQYI